MSIGNVNEAIPSLPSAFPGSRGCFGSGPVLLGSRGELQRHPAIRRAERRDQTAPKCRGDPHAGQGIVGSHPSSRHGSATKCIRPFSWKSVSTASGMDLQSRTHRGPKRCQNKTNYLEPRTKYRWLQRATAFCSRSIPRSEVPRRRGERSILSGRRQDSGLFPGSRSGFSEVAVEPVRRKGPEDRKRLADSFVIPGQGECLHQFMTDVGSEW